MSPFIKLRAGIIVRREKHPIPYRPRYVKSSYAICTEIVRETWSKPALISEPGGKAPRKRTKWPGASTWAYTYFGLYSPLNGNYIHENGGNVRPVKE